MMVYEAEILIRRSDPRVLADDFQAVNDLLERRRMERDRVQPTRSRSMRLVGRDA